jgi:hypothetical protein
LLVVVWDENDFDFTHSNNIPMVIDGGPRLVQPGVNNSDVNHFDLLKTLEGYYGLAPTGLAATADGLPSNGGGKLIKQPVAEAQQTLGDGNHTADIALLRNYMASSFATSSDGQGGTLISEAAQGGSQPPLIAQPHV